MENNINLNEQKESEITIRQALDFLLTNWFWFLLSVVVCLSLGYIYTKTVQFKFSSTASIKIDEEYRKNAETDITSMMSGGIFNQKFEVDNEVLMLKSHTLMQKVVDTLNADILYYYEGKLRLVEAYAPDVAVKLDAEDSCDVFFGHFNLNKDKYTVNFDDNSTLYEGRYNVPFVHNNIRFMLSKNPKFNEDIENFKIKIVKKSLRKVASDYAGRINISPASKTTSIINISLIDPVPQKADDVINTLIAVYNDDAVNDKLLVAKNTQNFIIERLNVINEELSTVDTDVERFKKDNSSIDIATETGLFLNKASGNEEQIITIATQILLVESVQQYMIKYGDDITRMLPANIGIDDAGLNNRIEEYNKLVMTRNRLINGSSLSVDANPVVRDVTEQINSTRPTLFESLANLKKSLTLQQKSLEKRERDIAGKVRNVPTLEKESLAILRQQKIKESIYLFLLNKREETGLKLASTVPIAKVIDPARYNELPVSPKISLIMLVALIVGLGLPVGVILIINQLRTSISHRSEIESIVKTPIIGEIPSKGKNITGEKIVSATSRDIISEAFRIIRTNVDFMMTNKTDVGARTIMVTSTMPNEGKTFIALNLASALAITGKRVLLVDLDLRKSSLARKLNPTRRIGITNYLVGNETDIANVIYKNELDSVDIMYAGSVPPNPSELLVSKRLDEAFDTLKTMYDYIIVDTSPVAPVADGVIVNRIADATIYVIRIGYSDKRVLQPIQSLYNSKTLNNMYLVLSDVTIGRKYGYGGYGYGYGYGYGVAYGEGYTDNEDTSRNSIRKK